MSERGQNTAPIPVPLHDFGRFNRIRRGDSLAFKLLRLFALGSALAGASCASVPTWNARAAVENPIFVSSSNQELVTERAVDILHKYNFEVDSTNQLEGTIATQYKVGSGLLEPWHKESVGCDNR